MGGSFKIKLNRNNEEADRVIDVRPGPANDKKPEFELFGLIVVLGFVVLFVVFMALTH